MSSMVKKTYKKYDTTAKKSIGFIQKAAKTLDREKRAISSLYANIKPKFDKVIMESDGEMKKREQNIAAQVTGFKNGVERGVSALSEELEQTKKNVAAEILMQEE